MVLLSDLRPDARTVPFANDLAAHGDRVAVITAAGEVSYRSLAARVRSVAERLGGQRRLVLLSGNNTVDSVVGYLAALAAGHAVLLAPDGTAGQLDAAYHPDVVMRTDGDEWSLDERRAGSAHTLHPDLALLLSTSGSTGSPKLVRLSHRNVQANAESIATYLDIRDSDRAATTLPMHYCYGLSVINSHLLRGAGLIMTDRSVVDPDFWELFRRAGGTAFAGVPYTFDLLDRVGFGSMRLPGLRYVTQAGGRLAPERVKEYAALGRRDGWKLYVMYGQTEATARMAYLPPDLAESHPQAIGVPIPGGSFRLDPLEEGAGPDTGELVYSGPNVMLGYAETPSDLRLGRAVDELRTGDLARRTGDGLYELVGRRSRFVKVFGLRLDLQRIEAMLESHGRTACCLGDDDELVVAVDGGDAEHLRRLVARECGLPARAVRVCVLDELPRLPTGKPDHRAVRAATTAPVRTEATTPAGDDLRALFADVLDRSGGTEVTEDSSFVSLGGDSLSFVEMSVRLERTLGHLPDGWHTMRIRDLRTAAAARPARKHRRMLDTGVALRALAIVLIVGSHIDLLDLPGGAHVLLAVAGFNLARFHLTRAERRDRARHLGTSIARIAVPSMAWIALVFLLTDDYDLANVFLLNEVVGPRVGTERYFWFVETIVYILLAVTAVVSVPLIDRLERRLPFGFPMALLALALVVRHDPFAAATAGAGSGAGSGAGHTPTPVALFWLFALGWAAAKATTVPRRLCVSVALLATVPGYFGNPRREAVVVAGLLLLIWVSGLPSVRPLNRLAGILAGSSLCIYLTHWQVYPYLDEHSELLALLASLVVGVLYATVATRAMARGSRVVARGSRVMARGAVALRRAGYPGGHAVHVARSMGRLAARTPLRRRPGVARAGDATVHRVPRPRARRRPDRAR